MSTNDPMTQEQLDAIQARLDCGTPTTDDVPALLAEVERLRARLTVDDAMVERVAGTLWVDNAKNMAFLFEDEDEDGSGDIDLSGWSDLDSDARGSWLELARAVLDAALGTGEGS